MLRFTARATTIAALVSRLVRTRCGAAVQALIACSADPCRRNKNGSTSMLLAIQSTGTRVAAARPTFTRYRGRAVRLLEQHGATRSG